MASRAKRERPLEVAQGSLRTQVADQDLELFYASVFLPLVRRATWKHHLSKDDASDLVQDAFVLAIRKMDLARNPKAWLTQVVDHLAVNFQRKTARRAQLVNRWADPYNRDPKHHGPEVND